MRSSVVSIVAWAALSSIGCGVPEGGALEGGVPDDPEATAGRGPIVGAQPHGAARAAGEDFVQVSPPPVTVVVGREQALRLSADETARHARQNDPVQLARRLKDAAIVVVGRVIADRKVVASSQQVGTTLEILTSIRGSVEPGERIAVTQPSDGRGNRRACTGIDFVMGHDYLLFLRLDENGDFALLSDPVAGPAAFRRSTEDGFASATGAIVLALQHVIDN
jgi:hypothetical protein